MAEVDTRPAGMTLTHFPCSERAFVLPVFDRRNEPLYLRGDHLVIDPLEKPLPGDMVLAEVDKAPLFGM